MNEPVGPFEVKYEAGHSYEETWENCELFCPNCGKHGSVWNEMGEGDYYQGVEFLCTNCDAEFYLPTGVQPREGSWQNKQRLGAIRAKEALQNPPNK